MPFSAHVAREASNSSAISILSADGSDGAATPSSHLSRAKSVSSVSSVTSTSSMEAAPFRAAPLGNIRIGYSQWGVPPGPRHASANGRVTVPTISVPTRQQSLQDFQTSANAAAAEAEAEAALQPASTHLSKSPQARVDSASSSTAITPKSGRQRGVTPKMPNDSWHYRNAPGMGSSLGGRPLPGSHRNLRELVVGTSGRSGSDASPPNVIRTLASPLLTLGLGMETAGPSDDIAPPSPSRRGPLRSKLAKSASKLGLKPLTVSSGTAAAVPMRSRSDLPQIFGPSSLGEGLDATAMTERGALSGLPQSLPTPTGFVNGDPIWTLRTSSVTNAPLIVSKRFPLPDGMTSPLTLGTSPLSQTSAAANAGQQPLNPEGEVLGASELQWPSPLLTPSRQSEELEPLAALGSQSRPASPNSARRARGKMSANGLKERSSSMASTLPPISLSAAAMASASSHFGLNNASLSSPSSQLLSPTPAELIRMEAQAGIATLPEEPSGAMSGLETIISHGSSSRDRPEPAVNRRFSSKTDGKASSRLHPEDPAASRMSPARAAGSLPSRRSSLRKTKTDESIASTCCSEKSMSSADLDKSAALRLESPESGDEGPIDELRSFQWEARKSTKKVKTVSANVTPPSPAGSRHLRHLSASSDGSFALELGAEAANVPSTRKSKFALTAMSSQSGTLATLRQRRPQPPQMTRMESTATEASKAVSDTSDLVPPVPFKRPIPQLAGKISIPDIQPELIDGAGVATPASPAEDALSTTAVTLAQRHTGVQSSHAALKPSTASCLSVVEERLPDGRSLTQSSDSHLGDLTSNDSSSPDMSQRTSGQPLANNKLVPGSLGGSSDSKLGDSAKSSLSSADVRASSPANQSYGISKTRSREDFEFGDILGEGSYSTVMLSWDLLSNLSSDPSQERPRATTSIAAALSGTGAQPNADLVRGKQPYAIKVLDKVHILKERKQKYVAVEKEASSLLVRHPGIITLYWTFQDKESLYFVLELAPNGELLSYIKRFGSFNEATTRYYAAQLLEAIAAMHCAGVIHRDIKPENVLLDASMRIKVTDFGSAKILPSAKLRVRSAVGKSDEVGAEVAAQDQAVRARASSFVGTAEYVSPELLTGKAATEASDFWAFGCVVFQMLAGRPPFKAMSEYQTFQKIIKRDFAFPDGFPDDAKDLINQLLILDWEARLGSTKSGGIDAIKNHRFFAGVDWPNLWNQPAPRMQSGLVAPPPPLVQAGGKSRGSSQTFGSHDWTDDNGGFDDQDSENEDQSQQDDEPVKSHQVQIDAQHFGMNAASSSTTALKGSDNVVIRDGFADEAAFHDDDDSVAAASTHVDADDDASSLSDGPSYEPGGGCQSSAGGTTAERVGPARKGSSLLRLAANVTGLGPGDRINGNEDNHDAPGSNAGLRTTASSYRSLRPRFLLGNCAASTGDEFFPSLEGSAPRLASMSYRNSGQLSSSLGVIASGLQTNAPPGQTLNWAALLLPSECVLYASPTIHRKTGTANLQSKRRVLILTDFPRLLCVKEDAACLKVKSEVLLATLASNNVPKLSSGASIGGAASTKGSSAPSHARVGSAPMLLPVASYLHSAHGSSSSSSASTRLSQQFYRSSSPSPSPPQQSSASALLPTSSANRMLSVDQKGSRSFVVHTPTRAYHYDDPSGDATNWVKSIRRAAAGAADGQSVQTSD